MELSVNTFFWKSVFILSVIFTVRNVDACYFDFAAQTNFDSFTSGCTGAGGTFKTSGEGLAIGVTCTTVDNWNYTSSFPLTCPTAPPPPPQASTPPTNVNTSTACGSVIRVDSLVLEESVAISGTPFSMHYTSARAIGRYIDRKKIIPIVENSSAWEAGHEYRITQIEIAGRSYSFSRTSVDPPEIDFNWDGKDQSGNLVRGSAEIVIKSDDQFDPPNANEQTYIHRQRIGTYYAVTVGMGGWTISDHHLYDHGSKKLYLGTGEEVSVAPIAANSGTNTLILSPNGDEVFEFNSSGLHLSTKTGIKGTTKLTFSYDTSERLTSISDQFSNTTTFTYTSGNLSSITGPYGKVTTVTTDSDGYISSITSPNSETHSMTYLTVGFPAGGLLVSFEKPNGIVSTFSYDVYGNLQSDSSAAGSSITLSSLGYNDAQSRTVTTTSAEGVSKEVQISYSPVYGTYTRTESGPFDQSYSANITPGGVSNENGTTSMGLVWTSGHAQDPRFTPGGYFPSYQTWATTNVSRNLQTTRAATLSDPMNPFSVTNLTETFVRNSTKTTTVAYLGSTSKFTVTSPVGRKTYQTIDSHERLVSEQHATYTPVTYTYDSRNRLATVAQSTPRTTTFSYNTDGYLQSVTNALSQVTSYTYDADGRVLTTTLPDSRVIGFSYDASGNLASVTPPGGAVHGLLSNGFDLLAKYTAPATSFLKSRIWLSRT